MQLTQDAQFLAQLKGIVQDQSASPRTIGFLDEYRREAAREYLRGHRVEDFLFDGGYPQADRVLLTVYPPKRRSRKEVQGMTVRFRQEDELSHRDILGAVLSLGVTRESVGDILIEPGRAVVFTFPHVAALILSELHKVGRVGVKVMDGFEEPLPVKDHFEDRVCTVSSLRLDCLVGACTGLSREKSAQLVRQSLVRCNAVPVQRGDYSVAQGSVLSIRGYGKFLFAREMGETKKGRLKVLFQKYL